MDERFTVCENDVPDEENVDPQLRTEVKSILGATLFPVGWCWLEGSYATIRLTHYASKPWPAIKEAALRVLKWLVVTKHHGIKFSRNLDDLHGHKLNELYAYVDVSFADDQLTRRSTIGYLIFLNGGPIAWHTKLAPTLVKSTTHAELAALAQCVEEVVQIRLTLEKLCCPQDCPTLIYEDNESCITIINNKRTAQNKHINVQYEFVREQDWLRRITLVPCSTLDQRADGMTKPLGSTKLASNMDGVVYDSRQVLGHAD